MTGAREMRQHGKRVVIVGSGGRLGRCLMDAFARDHHVFGFDHNQLDLGCAASIEAALGRLEFDELVLTAAWTVVDACEARSAEAMAVNAAGPARIAAICREKAAHMTYLSTDMVFGGAKEGLYAETDDPAPLSVYGRSKLAGEERVLDISAANLVVRLSWLFGPWRPAFPEWVIAQACVNEVVELPGDKVACPTYTMDVAVWLAALICGDAVPSGGIYHLCNAGVCTWREWGQYCVDVAYEAGMPIKARTIAGVPVDSVAAFIARRPVNSALDTNKFQAATGIMPRPWREAVRDHLMARTPASQARTPAERC